MHQIELEIQNDELRRSQEELAATKACYFDLYDLAPVGYCTISERGLILEINFTGATLLGMARRELLKLPLSRFILPEDQDIFYHYFKALFASSEKQVSELRMAKGDGTMFWARLESMVAQNEKSVPTCRLVFTDITEHKHVQEELIASDRRFVATFQQAAVGMAHVGLDGGWIRVNKKLCQILGYHWKELIQKTFQEITYPDDLGKDREKAQQLFDGKIETYTLKKRYVKKDQTTVWTNMTKSLMRKPSGEPDYYIAVIEDIEDRKTAEDALRVSEEIFKHFMLNSPIYVFFKDQNLRTLRLSKNYEQCQRYRYTANT